MAIKVIMILIIILIAAMMIYSLWELNGGFKQTQKRIENWLKVVNK